MAPFHTQAKWPLVHKGHRMGAFTLYSLSFCLSFFMYECMYVCEYVFLLVWLFSLPLHISNSNLTTVHYFWNEYQAKMPTATNRWLSKFNVYTIWYHTIRWLADPVNTGYWPNMVEKRQSCKLYIKQKTHIFTNVLRIHTVFYGSINTNYGKALSRLSPKYFSSVKV